MIYIYIYTTGENVRKEVREVREIREVREVREVREGQSTIKQNNIQWHPYYPFCIKNKIIIITK